jgi:hypothetical protein
MAKKKNNPPGGCAQTIALPAPLAIGCMVRTLIGTLIYIKGAKVADKTTVLDCLVLRDTFDGPMHLGRPVTIEIGSSEQIHASRHPLCSCVPVQMTDELYALVA